MGNKKLLDDPYQKITKLIHSMVAERDAHPELLSPSQSKEEIAGFILGVIQEPDPKLRYQTSNEARAEVSKKICDLSGSIYQDIVEQENLADEF